MVSASGHYKYFRRKYLNYSLFISGATSLFIINPSPLEKVQHKFSQAAE